MKNAGMTRTLEGLGYNPDTTPVDVLMSAPCGVGLTVAEDMLSDHDYADAEPHPRTGFQNEDGEMRFMEIETFADYEGTEMLESFSTPIYPEEGGFFGYRVE